MGAKAPISLDVRITSVSRAEARDLGAEAWDVGAKAQDTGSPAQAAPGPGTQTPDPPGITNAQRTPAGRTWISGMAPSPGPGHAKTANAQNPD